MGKAPGTGSNPSSSLQQSSQQLPIQYSNSIAHKETSQASDVY